MTSPANPVPGADVGSWGTKLNSLLDWLRDTLTATKATADAAETPTGAQAKVNTLAGSLSSLYEARIVRTGHATNDLVGLAADGTLTLRTPAAGTTINPATTSAAGIVTLAGDGGTTSGTVVQAQDARLSNQRVPTDGSVTPIKAPTLLAWTTTTTRPTGAGKVLFLGADPGTNAQAGDLWIGDLA